VFEFVRRGDDAFGKALLDLHETGKETVSRVIRLDDGRGEDMESSTYFQPFDEWPALDRALVQWMEGRVLDVGVGAGRLALFLQEKGHDVVGIDQSPGAVEVARARGVKDVLLHDILSGPLDGESFQVIALFGANLGIAGFHGNVGPFLETLGKMLTPGGRIIGTQLNWERTTKAEHLAFQEANRKAGKHPVEFTLRISYGGLDEDFSWCLTNQEELVEVAGAVGLVPEAIIDCREPYGYVLKLPQAGE
jgi:SAM-dependent methyltransferase